MNKLYSKPVVLLNEELSEGVYAASGSDCYTASATIHQRPQTGRGDYRMQVNGRHSSDYHHGNAQVAILTFNLPVKYVSSNGTLVDGDGTNVLQIAYSYHQNATDNIGLGDVVVTADAGLTDPHVEILCNLHDEHTP